MALKSFPSVELADEDGLLAAGGDLEVDTLRLAYSSGIFPWPVAEELPITWFAPSKRAVLFFDEFHISKSLSKALRHSTLTITFDQSFAEVIALCAEVKNRGSQRGTWITQKMIDAYIEFHRAGFAHSVECFEDKTLVGGLYGVSIGKMFAGESMFYRKPNASKFCLVALIERLRSKGVKWMDCQVMTPFLKSFGARDISRDEFMKLLNSTLADGSQ